MSVKNERAIYIQGELGAEQFQLLKSALLDCATIRDDSRRDSLFRLLRADIQKNTSRNSAAEFDLINILDTCLRYPDGVAELIFQLRDLEKETVQMARVDRVIMDIVGPGVVPEIQYRKLLKLIPAHQPDAGKIRELYRKSLPQGMGMKPGAQDISDILRHLADIPVQSDSCPYSILAFAERIALQIDDISAQREIREWLAETADLLAVSKATVDDFRAKIVNEDPDESIQPYLLIELFPFGLDNNTVTVQAWLWRDKDDVQCMYAEEAPVSKEELKQVLDKLITESAEDLLEATKDLTIEFLLPRELFCWEFDQWPVKAGSRISSKVGIRFPIVVRSRDRMINRNDATGRWKEKWRKLLDVLSGSSSLPIFWIESNEYTGDTLFAALMANEDSYCLGVAFAPPEVPLYQDTDVLDVAVEVGMPVALWVRQSYVPTGKLKEEVETFLSKEKDPINLPKLLRKKRAEASARRDEKDFGNHLILLWDDPERLLPDSPLMGLQREYHD